MPSAWTTVGRAAAATARTAGLVLLYCLRFALAVPQTARGLRRMVLDAAPLPPLRQAPGPEGLRPPRTKKAVLLALYRTHPHYGDHSQTAGSPPNWPPEPGCRPAPPAPTCTQSWTAGHHDHGPAR